MRLLLSIVEGVALHIIFLPLFSFLLFAKEDFMSFPRVILGCPSPFQNPMGVLKIREICYRNSHDPAILRAVCCCGKIVAGLQL